MWFANNYEHRHFERYVSKLTKWDYSLAACAIDKDVLPQRFNVEYLKKKHLEIGLEKDLFCVNRYRYALAFRLQFQYFRDDRHGKAERYETGPLIFLPSIALNPDETRQVVLADICGAQTSIGEPEWIEEWIDGFPPPGQRQIDEEIKRIEADLDAVAKKLQSADSEGRE